MYFPPVKNHRGFIAIKAILFIFLIPLLSLSSGAQKVGVVLSGGGAWGVAHIGVLKELERNNIPIDFIAGTSMGALIGGMYAAGYSPEEMEAIVTHPDFSHLVTGKISPEYTYYFKMPEPNASILNLKLNLDSGQLRTSIPTAIISAYNYDFKMMELLAGASEAAGHNFDSLFVPFRCVGADIRKKSEVIFRDGYLPSAVRVSATYPLYMRPLKIKGSVLFDGGLYNNFPADVIDKDFFPDFIIGSNVVGPGGSSELSEDDLIGQIKTMVMSPTNYEPICENMVIITPVISTSLFDFTDNARTLKEGEIAAQRLMDTIKMYSPRFVPKSEVEEKRKAFKAKIEPLDFENVYVTGLKKLPRQYVQKLLRKKRKDTLSLGFVKKRFFKISADERIKDIYPMALFDFERKKYNLYLKMKSDQSLEVSLGGNLSTKPYNTAYVGVKFKRLWNVGMTLHANGSFGRVYNNAHFTGRLDIPGRSPFSISTFYNFNQYNFTQNFNFFIETKKRQVLLNQNEHQAGIDFGFPSGRQGKINSGAAFVYSEKSYYQTPFLNLADTADKSLFRLATAHLTYELNTLDRKQYASKGAYISASVRFVHGAEDFFPGNTGNLGGFKTRFANWAQFRIAGEKFFFRYKKVRISFRGELYYSMQPIFGNYRVSNIMARPFQPIPELTNLFLPQYRSNEFIAGGTRLVYTPIKNLDVRGELHVFQPFREIQQMPDGSARKSLTWFYRTYFITSLAVVYHTPVGPVSLNYNYYHHADRPHSVYFNIGFILHNKKGLE